jgi:hypothetical protein
MAKLFGSCERFAYRPCSTSDIAGLNAASPALAPLDDGRGAGAGAAAFASASFSFSSSARMRAS